VPEGKKKIKTEAEVETIDERGVEGMKEWGEVCCVVDKREG